MTLPRIPNDPSVAIPRQPFSTPLVFNLCGQSSSIIVGTGLCINAYGVICSTGGGGGGSGTVTSISTSTGLVGGPITTSGTIALANTAVSAGVYTNAGITVDAQGRITSATSGATPSTSVFAPLTNAGTSIAPILSISAASTSACGVVQLNNTLTCTSTALALTAAQGKALQDQITAIPTPNTTVVSPVINSGTSIAPIISVSNASTSAAGIVQLNNTATSTSTSLALTAAQGKALQDQITAIPTPNTTVTSPISNSGTSTAPIIGIAAASITQTGAVQLNNTLTSTSTALALTAAQGKNLQDQISALSLTSNITLAGTFSADTGLVDVVTTQGAAAGFIAGASIPAAVAGNAGYYVIVDQAGTVGPAGTPPYDVGDWFLSNGSVWQFLNVGYSPGTATTTSQGVVQLATNSQVQVGTDSTNAVVSSALQSKISDSIATTSSTTIASSTAVKSAYDLAALAIPKSCIASKGALITGTAASTPVALPVGSDGQILAACSACADGLTWTTVSLNAATTAAQGVVQLATALEVQTGTDSAKAVVSSALQSKISDSVATTSSTTIASSTAVKSAYDLAALAVPKACFTAKGAILVGTAASASTALPLGTDSYILTACAACTSGVTWASVGSSMGDTPVGAVQYFAMSTAPTGWLVADGSAVSRTTYADLYGKIGTIYGAGDGSTTFNLPKVSGQFLRGYNGTGSGCDVGRVFGTTQSDSIRCHQHLFPYGEGGGVAGPFGCTATAGKFGSAGGTDLDNYWWFTNNGTDTCSTVINPTGVIGAETRPPNIAMLPCIKWQVTTAPATSGIPIGCVTGKGALITGTAASTPVGLAVGTDGQVLVACSTCADGLTWSSVGASAATPLVAGTVLGLTSSSNTSSGLGYCALTSLTTGVYNTAVGFNAAPRNSTGTSNTAVGAAALTLNTIGSQNTAVGASALFSAVSGCHNTAIGFNALCCNTTGLSNVAVGSCALAAQCIISNNTAVGFAAARCNVTGGSLVAVGNSALYANTTGSYNIAVGLNALSSNTTGSNNTAVGSSALTFTTTGICNTAFGYAASAQNTTGEGNVSVGAEASAWGQTGSYNVAMGLRALHCNISTSNTIAIGACALYFNTTGQRNTAIGTNALLCNTTGGDNIVVGNDALTRTTTGCCNTAVGVNTLYFNTTGFSNTAFGHCALNCGTGNGNVAIGAEAMRSTTANNSTAVGNTALQNNTTGIYNTAVGFRALFTNTTGGNNVALGNLALQCNTTACSQVALGSCALGAATTGGSNVAVGTDSLRCLTTGDWNEAFGTSALKNLTTGSYNIAIGDQANCNLVSGCNNIYITSGSTLFTQILNCATNNNNIVVGNFSNTNAYIKIGWTVVSDVRDKAIDPAGVPYGLAFVNQIQPIAYQFCDRATGEINDSQTRYGFSAQNIDELEGGKGVIANNDDTENLKLTPDMLIPVLVNAIKELSAEVAELKARFD